VDLIIMRLCSVYEFRIGQ